MRVIRWLNDHVEDSFIFPLYFCAMWIMAIGVIQRFFFHYSWHWGIEVNVAMFVWFSWVGCAVNVKNRSHLTLNTLRAKMPRSAQFALLMLDYVLWIVFAFIASYHVIPQIFRLHAMDSMIYGSALIPKWSEPLCIPVAFTMVVFRVIQKAIEDIKDFRRGAPMKIAPEASLSVQL